MPNTSDRAPGNTSYDLFATPSGRVITTTDSGLVFKSLKDEQYREYHYRDQVEHIEEPVALRVAESGGHYVIDGNDLVHYLPKGWTRLTWKAKDGVALVGF